MATGIVKWFNNQKGYGFIIPESGEGDVFVHISALEKAGLETLLENQQIEFELTQSRDKIVATDLKLLTEATEHVEEVVEQEKVAELELA